MGAIYFFVFLIFLVGLGYVINYLGFLSSKSRTWNIISYACFCLLFVFSSIMVFWDPSPFIIVFNINESQQLDKMELKESPFDTSMQIDTVIINTIYFRDEHDQIYECELPGVLPQGTHSFELKSQSKILAGFAYIIIRIGDQSYIVITLMKLLVFFASLVAIFGVWMLGKEGKKATLTINSE